MNKKQIENDLLSLMFGYKIADNFIIEKVEEYKKHVDIKLKEKKELVPDILKGTKKVVLDGYCNPLKLQAFPLKGKAVYLKLYRRRWKVKGTKKHYSNEYNLNEKGVKAIRELSSFLK